jgi:hypothetical protein
MNYGHFYSTIKAGIAAGNKFEIEEKCRKNTGLSASGFFIPAMVVASFLRVRMLLHCAQGYVFFCWIHHIADQAGAALQQEKTHQQ